MQCTPKKSWVLAFMWMLVWQVQHCCRPSTSLMATAEAAISFQSRTMHLLTMQKTTQEQFKELDQEPKTAIQAANSPDHMRHEEDEQEQVQSMEVTPHKSQRISFQYCSARYSTTTLSEVLCFDSTKEIYTIQAGALMVFILWLIGIYYSIIP